MLELAKFAAQFTPGAAGVWVLVAMGIGWFTREYRETRKLSDADKLARREGYAKQVTLLTAENRALMADQSALRAEYDQYRKLCHAETDQLRDQVVSLENKIAGLMRKLADVAVRAARGGIDADMAASILRLATEVQTSGVRDAGPKH